MAKVYYPVARMDDFARGDLKRVEAGGRSICLVQLKGQIFAIDDTCTHECASLSEGTVRGNRIECPLHGGMFDFASGEPVQYPAVQPIKTYSVEINGDEIRVGIRRSIRRDDAQEMP